MIEATTPHAAEQAFRDTMASVCSPVTVVTAMDGARPHGTTVSAFSSLSLSPPLAFVALERSSELLAIVERERRFAVNLLAHDQGERALALARKGTDKLTGVDWQERDGLPWIVAAGWLACEVAGLLPGGDHAIVLGRVIASEPLREAPLVYRNRSFGTYAELAAPGGCAA
jgi:flavin reductase (DIM6/NTAB) family NADH-FMN oxidoreductase RutF